MNNLINLLSDFDYKINDDTILIYHLTHQSLEDQVRVSNLKQQIAKIDSNYKIIIV